eukprot:3142232-Prymnesium_polylepis.1
MARDQVAGLRRVACGGAPSIDEERVESCEGGSCDEGGHVMKGVMSCDGGSCDDGSCEGGSCDVMVGRVMKVVM